MTSLRKRSLLIALILLLIGGGGAAFYLHLRTQAPLVHDELFDLREASLEGWKLDSVSGELAKVQTRPVWLTQLGFREEIYHQRDFYQLHHQETGESVVLTVLHEDWKISGLRFSGSSPNIETLKEAIARRFPQLRSRF